MNYPIRILHVLGKLNRGGAETMVMNLYRNLDKEKIQFDFIVHTDEESDYDKEILELGGRIYKIPRYKGVNHLTYLKSWNNFFSQHREYRIVHGHVRSTAAIYLKIARKYNLITVAHSHSTSSGSGASAYVKNLFQLPIRYEADFLFACSRYAGEWLFGEKATKKENFFIFKNAISPEEFSFNEKTRNIKRKELAIRDEIVIGHVGRFQPPKNHEMIIEIFQEVHKRNENVKLLLVGDGDLKEVIERRVFQMGLSDSVIFTGVREDISDLYQAMDIFILPSYYEGLGIVAIEAQAAGLPCFVSDQIPDEAIVTNLLRAYSLLASKKDWAEKILATSNLDDRRNTSKEIQKAGYDIKITSLWLSQFYMDALSETHIEN